MKTILLLTLTALLALADVARAQGTAFTYQGRLTENGAAANGPNDLTFTLYNAASGGATVGVSNVVNDLVVTNGLFTVTLDYGASAFDGSARWLQIAVRPGASAGAYANLTPRQPITATPYAVRALSAGSAGTATTATSVSAGGVNNVALANDAVDGAKILNGSITSADLNASLLTGTFWNRTGNAGANPTNGAFLGTTDNLPLEFKVNGTRGLRLQPAANGTVHVIGGHSGNVVSGSNGGTIAGGGGPGLINQVTNDYGTVGGGWGNTAGGQSSTVAGGNRNTASAVYSTVAGGVENNATGNYSTVPGGYINTAAGTVSFAAGTRAEANHEGTFVWADNDFFNGFASTANNQFLIRARGGVGINTNNPNGAALAVSGTVTATRFTGDGSGLTGISAASVTSGTVPAAALDNAWKSTGNAGINPAVNFLGTTDNLPLEFKVNGTRGLRLEPAAQGTVHVIGGHSGNVVNAEFGGTIAGGGGPGGVINQVTNDFGTVGGGWGNTAGGQSSTVAGGNRNTASVSLSTVGGGFQNTASGIYSTVPGGYLNTASGSVSFAAGTQAEANHNGTFVWADNEFFNPFASTANNQFLVRARGGVGINTNNPNGAALAVAGTVTATSFTGNGSGLTGISAANVTSGTVPAAALDNAWKSTGNAGINPAANFLGTTDNQPLEFRVNGTRGLRLEPAQLGTVHVIGGYSGNVVSAPRSATIAGGGDLGSFINRVTESYGTVGGGRANIAGYIATVAGGENNTASGSFSTVPGGSGNTAAGSTSFAAGARAKANHEAAFVWADRSDIFTDFASTAPNQFLIRAAGGVGIGKNNPATALDVAGTVTATGFAGDGSGLTGVAKLGAANTFTANQTMTGSVGIGTDNPADRLHLVGRSIRARVQSTDGTFAGYIAKNSAAEWFTGVNGSGGGEWTLFQNSPSSAPRLVVTTSGNVGIGTETPATALHVKTDAPNAGVARFDNRHPGGFAGIYFDEDNQYRGYVGYVNSQSDLGGPGTMQLGARGSLVFSADPGGFFNERMRINGSNGNVGIGRTPTANKLEVEGNASKNTAGSWLANSDRRIKQDIQTVESALDTLNRVRLVSFRYTHDYRAAHPSVTDRPYLNVVAQEFAEVFPDHVQSSGEKLPDGSEILQVDTYPLTIYSAAAVQELAAKVESGNRKAEEREASLRSELQRRDAKIAALEARLEKLERMMEAKGGAR